ncbi:ATP-binding protein [Dankookia sp. GCM10030260]|uniref:ATP-binding protein n=1 Tax=Dankookia sp. GCM10030260 TaxID=3273390 RepID=UPI00360616F1
MVRPDGSHIWVERHARIAERFPDGSAELVGTITDITRERTLVAQVQASAKLATLGEMIAGLAHGLGQPAATMYLAAGNAARGLRNRGEAAIPDALRRLDRIVAQGERMGTLMEHLKAFARAEPLALGPVSVRGALDGALVLTGGRTAARRDGVRAGDRPRPAARVEPMGAVGTGVGEPVAECPRRDAPADPPGQPRRIRLSAALAAEGRVAIEVADIGGGLDPAVLARLFDPVFTTKPMGEGLGLGLSVSHGLVHGMGSSIAAANGTDGAVFTVTLACAPALAAA